MLNCVVCLLLCQKVTLHLIYNGCGHFNNLFFFKHCKSHWVWCQKLALCRPLTAHDPESPWICDRMMAIICWSVKSSELITRWLLDARVAVYNNMRRSLVLHTYRFECAGEVSRCCQLLLQERVNLNRQHKRSYSSSRSVSAYSSRRFTDRTADDVEKLCSIAPTLVRRLFRQTGRFSHECMSPTTPSNCGSQASEPQVPPNVHVALSGKTKLQPQVNTYGKFN